MSEIKTIQGKPGEWSAYTVLYTSLSNGNTMVPAVPLLGDIQQGRTEHEAIAKLDLTVTPKQALERFRK